jgi:hypothetical protein
MLTKKNPYFRVTKSNPNSNPSHFFPTSISNGTVSPTYVNVLVIKTFNKDNSVPMKISSIIVVVVLFVFVLKH